MDFSFGFGLGSSAYLLSGYKPHINYSWSNTFQAANKMYSKNIGNSGQNLQLFSGQGVKFNGTNQTITIPVNATIMTEIKRINGAVVLNTTQQVITNYVIGTGSAAIHTDYFLFTDALTQQEIELYTNNPNKFFQDTRDGVIDNCVLNMPLHGVDASQYNYANQTTYQVLNYTADCVTLAKQLSYGSQEANFFHKSSGVPIRNGLSPFFESTPYWSNYVNTGWIPKWNENFTVETILGLDANAQFKLSGNNYADGVYFGKHSTVKKLYVRVFGSTAVELPNTNDIACLTFSYDWQTKKVKQYVDGVLKATQLATQTSNSDLPVLLGLVASTGTSYPLDKPTRLFKVHNKVLTQEEITKNFNEYIAKGLLANFVLDENGDYMQDEFGNYIMDI